MGEGRKRAALYSAALYRTALGERTKTHANILANTHDTEGGRREGAGEEGRKGEEGLG